MVFAASGENLFEARCGAKDFFDSLIIATLWPLYHIHGKLPMPYSIKFIVLFYEFLQTMKRFCTPAPDASRAIAAAWRAYFRLFQKEKGSVRSRGASLLH